MARDIICSTTKLDRRTRHGHVVQTADTEIMSKTMIRLSSCSLLRCRRDQYHGRREERPIGENGAEIEVTKSIFARYQSTSTHTKNTNTYNKKMKLQLLHCVLLSSHLWMMATGSKSHTRIIGGNVTESGRFAYTVSFQDWLGHFCGGSIIARDVILSAA